MARKVALLGTTLMIDSLAAALADVPNLDLLRCEDTTAHGLTNMGALLPDVVIFDMALPLPESPLLDLLKRSDTVIVGCDLPNQQMLLLSGRSARLASVKDLLHELAQRTASHVSSVGHTSR